MSEIESIKCECGHVIDEHLNENWEIDAGCDAFDQRTAGMCKCKISRDDVWLAALRQATDRAERAERRVAELEGERPFAERIGWDELEGGEPAVDEVVGHGNYHLERMAEGLLWMHLGENVFHVYTKNPRGHLKFKWSEDRPASVLPPSSESTDG